MIHTQSHTLITDTLNSTPSNTHSLGSNNWPDTVSRIQSHHLNTHTHSVAHATKNRVTQSHTLNTHTLGHTHAASGGVFEYRSAQPLCKLLMRSYLEWISPEEKDEAFWDDYSTSVEMSLEMKYITQRAR